MSDDENGFLCIQRKKFAMYRCSLHERFEKEYYENTGAENHTECSNELTNSIYIHISFAANLIERLQVTNQLPSSNI